MKPLAELLHDTQYQGYAYAYPHKTAYRPLPEAVPFRSLWARERRDALFLYIHIPFCEMRCGFCNLFTQARPKAELTRRYLETLRVEAERVREGLQDARFARLAIGGGTPTFLGPADLDGLFTLAEQVMGVGPGSMPISVETSPGTADTERLTVLKARGVTRISMGVQSFTEAETSAVARPQDPAEVEGALERIRTVGFPTLNVDLIYGLPGQTVDSWLASLRTALRYRPEELYLYPLYVRPLTGLGKSRRQRDDLRLACYRAGRDLLDEANYQQVSMRMFRAAHAPTEEGPVYCCQEDGMVGLGCGARSYTRSLHYSREFAVGAQGVREILANYIDRPAASFGSADYGFRLNGEEQRRRFVIQSLLQRAGLDRAAYRRRFGSESFEDLPELTELAPLGLASNSTDRLVLTDTGLEWSDAIGPWLYSSNVRQRMEEYECR
jgi:oxygen-independent coproporphyrinogen-3 oxidase